MQIELDRVALAITNPLKGWPSPFRGILHRDSVLQCSVFTTMRNEVVLSRRQQRGRGKCTRQCHPLQRGSKSSSATGSGFLR